MLTNNQQLNTTDDFSEFDFDESDILIKDESKEVAPRKQENADTLKRKNVGTQEQENTKSRNQEIKPSYALEKMPAIGKPSDLSIRQPIGEPLAKRKIKIEAPLELKKLKIASEYSAEKMRENLFKQANMQKDKMEILGRKGDGLVYDEKDEEEIEKFKNNHLIRSGFNIDLLVRTLISQLNIVSTLKIDLINRLKNIIDSFLRDIRTAQATENLLQRSLDNGGLNLPSEHAEQIMNFISNEYKRIHSNIFVVADNRVSAPKEDDLVAYSKVESPQVESSEKKLIESPKVELLKEAAEVIFQKTARDAQVGIFSDEIADARKRDNSKTRFAASGKKNFAQTRKELAVPDNLRVLEISAPKSVKKLTDGTVAAEVLKAESQKTEEQKKQIKSNILFSNIKREEVLKSLNEELVQNESEIQDQEKQKLSWFFRLFRRKRAQSSKLIEHENSETPIRQAQGRLQHKNIKILKEENNESKIKEVPSSKFQVPSLEKKELPRSQSIVRRVAYEKPNFDNRLKMEDVKAAHPHLVGPIEELSEMTVLDFRRLGSTAQNSVDKIKEKIEISAKEFFNQKIMAINAWRKSQPNQLYIELGRKSLFQKMPVEDVISQYNLENKPTLTKQEFDLISKLNKELRY